MATSSEADVAAKLLERLLSDPAFRARFRRDPAGACREAGLDGLAQEMSVGGGKAMHTLDMRESKSSLAGVMMAAAMEGVAIYQFTENVLPHLEEIPGQITLAEPRGNRRDDAICFGDRCQLHEPRAAFEQVECVRG